MADSDEEKPEGQPKGTDRHLDALGPSKRGNTDTEEGAAQRGLHMQMETSDAPTTWLTRRAEHNNYGGRKDKAVQLEAITEAQLAKETVGTGGGCHREDKRRRSRQRGLLLVDGTAGLLKNACNVVILKLFQPLNCHQLDEGGRK